MSGDTSAKAAEHQFAIVYDAGCGFCARAVRWVLRWDRRQRLRAVPLGTREADALLSGIDADRREESWHLVAPDGRVRSAGDAIPALLRLLPGGGLLAPIASVSPRMTNAAYWWVARHREQLGRLTRSSGCSIR